MGLIPEAGDGGKGFRELQEQTVSVINFIINIPTRPNQAFVLLKVYTKEL